MKLTHKNIVDLWFSADTPIRQYKIKMNPHLWTACLKASIYFKAPSGREQIDQYRKSDKIAFAEAVLKELNPENHAPVESKAYDMV